MRRIAFVLLGLLLLPILPATPAQTADELVADYWVEVDGEWAHGLLAAPQVSIPEQGPRGLVVILHGYGHNASSHRGHLAHLAEQGFVAVAMDYRGAGFPLRAGADDTMAAVRDLNGRFPTIEEHYLYSVSMGTAVAGIVLAELPVFDYWVSNEGLAMLHETWAGASALAPVNAFAEQARDDIEAECGGSPAKEPACYAERSAALQAREFRTGFITQDLRPLKGVVLTHGLNDGLVPYNQGRELVDALRVEGIPSEFYTVVRGNPGGEGTTITGYAGVNVDGLAGHGTESEDEDTLTSLSFALLDEVVNGRLVPADREHVVDREAGTLP